MHPNDYYDKVGPKGQNEKPVGSGPYRVANHVLGKSITLERNPDYFKDWPKGQPKIVRKIEIRFIPDRQTQMAEMLSGGIDFLMHVPKDQADQLKAVPNLQVVSGETMRIVFLQMNAQESSAFPMLKDLTRAPGDQPRDRPRGHGEEHRRRRRARSSTRSASRRSSAAPTRARRATPTIRQRRSSCWPRPAIRTASTCRSTPIASATRPRR